MLDQLDQFMAEKMSPDMVATVNREAEALQNAYFASTQETGMSELFQYL
jgi:hypothetical protein